MKWWNEYIHKKVIEYAENLIEYTKNKVDRERLRWKVQVEGSRIDDLDDPPREIPFSTEKYFRNDKDANTYAVIQVDLGYTVEVWHLKKRY